MANAGNNRPRLELRCQLQLCTALACAFPSAGTEKTGSQPPRVRKRDAMPLANLAAWAGGSPATSERAPPARAAPAWLRPTAMRPPHALRCTLHLPGAGGDAIEGRFAMVVSPERRRGNVPRDVAVGVARAENEPLARPGDGGEGKLCSSWSWFPGHWAQPLRTRSGSRKLTSGRAPWGGADLGQSVSWGAVEPAPLCRPPPHPGRECWALWPGLGLLP